MYQDKEGYRDRKIFCNRQRVMVALNQNAVKPSSGMKLRAGSQAFPLVYSILVRNSMVNWILNCPDGVGKVSPGMGVEIVFVKERFLCICLLC